jgi:hypothetical protein
MHALVLKPRNRLQRAAAVALLVVLVLAQTLGWMHRGLHGASSPDRQAQPALHAHADADTGWMNNLFGSHADSSDCRLFDVLGKPGCAPAALVAVPTLAPLAFVAASHGDFVARWAALFDARGPPPSR